MSRRAAVSSLGSGALVAGAISLALATRGMASTYPPGPHGCCPDTLTIINVQNPAATPHPLTGDVVLGIGGIITGIADQFRPFGFYMQMASGLPYSGVPVYTGNVNHGPGTPSNLQIGDYVVVYGKVKSYQGAVAIGSLGGEDDIAALAPDSPLDAEDLTVRVVSHGNPLPPFHVGSLAELGMPGTNPAGRPWQGALVRLNGPLVVARILPDLHDDDLMAGGPHPPNTGFLVVDPRCPGPVCDTALVDCSTLTSFTPPPVGTALTFVQGCFDFRDQTRRIQIRGPLDIGTGHPPLATDAFPIFDDDLPDARRLDMVMVVFDRPVDQASAENAANYSLASLGTVLNAKRMDAPDDNRVVLQVHNGLSDGAPEALTVKDVMSLEDGTPMVAPQTLSFLNGVIELDKVRSPDPAALAGSPCDDRSRYSGPGSAPGMRSSFQGIVSGKFGDFYTLQDITNPTRDGMWVNAPGLALIPGHAYVLAGVLQEVAGETEGVGIVYSRDLGVGSSLLPAVQSVGVLLDQTCDAAQLFLTGDDLDGMLVKLDHVVVTGSQPAGASFYVATPGAGAQAVLARVRGARATDASEQILIAAMGGNFSYAAVGGRIVTITGVLGRVNGAFAVFPRGDSDIHDFGPVPTFSVPLNVSKAATASRDPDIVLGVNGELFMSWGRVFNESVHSLSLDNTENWSHPDPIGHQGVQPALAVTPSNKFCVVAASTESLFFKQSTDGGIQMDPIVTAVDEAATRYPSLTVGSGEHLHAAWERLGNGIWYARSLTGGADFSNPLPIAPDNQEGVTNSMARICADQEDEVFVFWQYHAVGEPGVDKVLYRRSLDGGVTFSTARLARDESNPLTSTVKLAILGDARVGPDGTVYVMGLQAGGSSDVAVLLKSTNHGFTFALAGFPNAPAESQLCPKSLAVGPDGSLHALIGVCGTALYYTRSMDGGATWSPAVNVTSDQSSAVGEPRGAKIILDATGTPVIVWFAPSGGSTEIYSSRLLN